MNNFVDEEFDGVAIKLKEFFINSNPNVRRALNTLKNELINAEFCVHEPNYKRSLYELQNMDKKVKEVRYQKAKEKDLIEKRRINLEHSQNQLLTHQKLTCSLTSVRCFTSHGNDTSVTFNNGEQYDLSDFITPKDNLRSELKKRFEFECNTYEKFIKFRANNKYLFNGIDEYLVCEELKHNLNIRLTVDSYGNVYPTHNAIQVNFHTKNKRGIVQYNSSLAFIKDGKIDTSLAHKHDVNLDDYTLKFVTINNIHLYKNEN